MKTLESNNKELQKNEADLFKCLEDKAVLEIRETEKNTSGVGLMRLSKEELAANVTSLAREVERLRVELREMNVSRAELGRTIVGLRARVESYSQWDRKQAEKVYSGTSEEARGDRGEARGDSEGARGALGNETLVRNSTEESGEIKLQKET